MTIRRQFTLSIILIFVLNIGLSGFLNTGIGNVSAAGPTEVSGYQSGTWTQANNPYIVTDDIIIEIGSTLTIQEGVIAKCEGSITVNGTLMATGTEANPITFTSNQETPTKGDWTGITFSESANITSTLSWCVVEYTRWGVRVESDVTISDCTFKYAEDGIIVDNAAPVLESNTIRIIGRNGIWLQEDSSAYVLNNTLSEFFL